MRMLSHVTPSFLTDDEIEFQSNFNLQVSLVQSLNYFEKPQLVTGLCKQNIYEKYKQRNIREEK